MPDRKIGAVFVDDVQVNPQLAPVPGGSGGFDDVAEFPFTGKLIHQLQVMLHGKVCQPFDRFIRMQQNRIGLFSRDLCFSAQVDVCSEGEQITFKVLQTAVDQLIAMTFDTVHIFQFLQNNVKGIMQGKDHSLFLSVYKAGFAAHIRIDQAE